MLTCKEIPQLEVSRSTNLIDYSTISDVNIILGSRLMLLVFGKTRGTEYEYFLTGKNIIAILIYFFASFGVLLVI